ncbi:MAG: putative Hybrid sensor histidine kinase [Candidatus Krumholzibacteriota bacterium]|nr:putative Hybrid sensor histidine kinase [Candidatus Krumholzibacteriota bacterium]
MVQGAGVLPRREVRLLETVLLVILGAAAGFAAGAVLWLAPRVRALRARLQQASDAHSYTEALIQNSPDGLIVVDEDWAIVQVNDAYCRITGRSREDLIGLRPPYPGWVSEERESIRAHIARVVAGDIKPIEFSYIRPDGQRLPLQFNPGIPHAKGGKKYFFAIVKDLSELKRREARLRESEATFRRIAETTTDGIYQLDLNGVIVYCSPAVEKILGYAPEEFVGTQFRSHFLPEDLQPAQNAFVRNLAGEEIRNAEFRIVGKNGKRVYIEVNATPMRMNGKIIGSQGIARDITERKLAEEQLRTSEARLRTAIDSIPFDLLVLDRDGRYVMQNTVSRKQWGDVTGMRPQDIASDAATLALWLDNNRRAFSGEVVQGEVSQKHGGKELYLHNIIAPVYESGEVRNILVLNIDITHRKLIEQALKDSEEKYRLLVENAGALVTMFDREGKLLFTNQIAARFLGGPPESLTGKTIDDFFPKDLADEYRARYKRVIDSGTPEQHEDHYETPRGTRWFRSILEPVRDQDGRGIAVQLVSHDTTELAQAERALRDRDARLRLMVSQVPAVLWTVDRDLRFTSSMGAGLNALGLAPGQVVGKDLYEYFETRDSSFTPIAMHRRSLEGEATTYEAHWNHAVWETHTEPLRDENGAIIGCLAIALDVTARKLAEEELKESRKRLRDLARRLQAVREDQSTNIARDIHDEIGQPLVGLKFDLSFLKRRLTLCEDPAERAEIEEKIKDMNGQIDAAIGTVQNLGMQLRPKMLDDLGLIGAIESFSQDYGRRAGFRCEVNHYGPPGSGSGLDFERSTAVFRIFQEILVNVRRHASASRVWIDLRGEDNCFILEVRDNGKGIPRDRLKRVEGLGILGMRERALVFEGTVSVDSEPGKGTRVEVRIPLGDAKESS